MSTTILKTPLYSEARLTNSKFYTSPLKSRSFVCVSFLSSRLPNQRLQFSNLKFSTGFSGAEKLHNRLVQFKVSAFGNGESAEAQTETQARETATEPGVRQENIDSPIGVEDSSINGESTDIDGSGSGSTIIGYLNLYKDAVANNDGSKVAEIEALVRSFEKEKIQLEQKAATLTEELSYERDRVLRISADFDNFRKRTERERLSLVTNAKGKVIENLLSVLDNFERAKAQIKIGSEGEEKISNSYQSIYKQFVEILDSLGVVSVDSVGKPFDPMLHEAIMREESRELEEGVILEEYRKGFNLGDRLLRPSMVKVSSGPGPSNPKATATAEEAELKTDIVEEEDSVVKP